MPDMLSRHDMGPLHVCHMSYKQIFEYRSRKTPYMYALYVCHMSYKQISPVSMSKNAWW